MLTIKTPERRKWRRSGVFIVNFEHISHPFPMFLIVDFEQVNVRWVMTFILPLILVKRWKLTKIRKFMIKRF